MPSLSPIRGRTTMRLSPSGRLPSSACILDDDLEKDVSEDTFIMDDDMDQSQVTHQVTTNRFWGNVADVMSRSLSPIRGQRDSGNLSRSPSPAHSRRTLPDRQSTFETAATAGTRNSMNSTCPGEGWEKERQDLLDKIEALESKLKVKESIFQCMMIEANANENSTNNQVAATTGHLGPLAVMVLDKERELNQMEATVKQQSIQLENLESQQEKRVEEKAELLFQEWQLEESDRQHTTSVWEQLQEQAERIATLEAENEYERQLHQREQKRSANLIQQLQADKHKMKEEQQLPSLVACVEKPKNADQEPTVSSLQQENQQLTAKLAQLQTEQHKKEEEDVPPLKACAEQPKKTGKEPTVDTLKNATDHSV